MLQAGLALRRFDSSTWAPGIDVPTSVVVTTADTVVAPSSQLALAAAIPGAEIYRVDGDHGVPGDRPGILTPVLIAACLSVAGQADPRPPAPAAHP